MTRYGCGGQGTRTDAVNRSRMPTAKRREPTLSLRGLPSWMVLIMVDARENKTRTLPREWRVLEPGMYKASNSSVQ